MRVEYNEQTQRLVAILEREDCHWCKGQNPGTLATPKWKVCEKCKGTGKRGNGRCRECNDRNGYYGTHGRNPGHVIWYDHDDRMPCTNCGGNYKDFGMEDYTDSLPVELWANMPIKVIRSGRGMTWQEQHLGAGVYTIVDYGSHKNTTDDELITKIRNELTSGKTKVQACKVVRSKDDLTLCAGLAIVTSDMGFSVLPYMGDD